MSLDPPTANGALQNGQDRPASAPPQVPPGNAVQRRPVQDDLRHRLLSSSIPESVGFPENPPLDLMPQLQRSGPSVVKTRTGSVLSRGFILKTDHYPSGRALDLDINVHGAPNFRAPRQGNLNVYGVAQPRTQGLRAILSVLRCRPNIPNPTHVVWFCTREEPLEPRRTLKLSDRAENLEDIERRLKNDILTEASKYGGLVLTHNEVATDAGEGEGAILPTWTAVDSGNVRTQRELMEYMRKEGWNVEYHRIPISPDRPIEDNYLDAYLRVIKQTDPLSTALVFNCGMGAQGVLGSLAQSKHEKADMGAELDKKNSQSAIELLLTHSSLLEALRKAHMGNYGIILSLLGCLEHGIKAKKLVDKVIDVCDHVVNLREDIFTNRVRYSLTTAVDDKEREKYLNKAVKSLEKYFFAIAFANYVEMQDDFKQSFADWLKSRTEIWTQVTFLRKSHGSRLNVFAPINDLSALSRTGAADRGILHGQQGDLTIAGGQILGDEYSDHVVKNRSGIILREGTLLKSDQWLSRSTHVAHGVRGAINFRNIPGTNIYALGQPTLEAIDEVVYRVHSAHPEASRIMWICLREEPIVYVNDYGGISAARLEMLEERLKEDVVNEVNAFGGRLLLHTETPDGSVVPIWEEVDPENVMVLKEVMAERRHVDDGVELSYARIPITAERPPDFTDLSELIEVMIRCNTSEVPIVINCQLGRGRSTLTAVILLLIKQWLARATRLRDPSTPGTLQRSITSSSITTMDTVVPRHTPRHSYQIINNLLRVIRKGPMVKQAVDDAIDQCSEVFNLREAIEEARSRAEQAPDERQRRIHAHRGLQNLRRYFELIIFQAYLQSTEPDTMQTHESFESFVKDRPVIKTFEKELLSEDLNTLKPLERVDVADGVALPDEVRKVVANRSGSILSASTILKSDFFSNLQKMSLPERIEGCPNFRRVPLALRLVSTPASTPGSDGHDSIDFVAAREDRWVCGCGMPTVDGLRRALQRVNAHPNGSNMVYWTSLREEPVIYVAGRPHVLRLLDKPLENVEATGVTTAVVEAMEESLKRDVLREVREGEGRILLHDEVEERPSVFSIIPIWEQVEEKDIMTPRDVYELMVKEGYKVDYDRVAVTDEQAPLPGALAQLLMRVRSGLESGEPVDFIFNCQMGRGRTTTGMVTACLIATTMTWEHEREDALNDEDQNTNALEQYDSIDGPSEEEAYLQGEYKVILQLVGVLSHGKLAKRLTDRAIDQMQDVQNLRKAIYDYKLKVEACEKGSAKHRKLMDIGVNYLYRYGALIVFANYLIEMREGKEEVSFPAWLEERREITMLLGRRSLD
ncbi:hypothetical protein ACG7TL_006840 [Trametes sanguinea]